MYGYSSLHIERIAERHLFGVRIDAERLIFFDDLVKLFKIITAVDTKPFEEIGKIFREIETEDIPPDTVR